MPVSFNWLSRLPIPTLVWAMEAAWVVPLVALALNGLAGRPAPFTPEMTLAMYALAGLGARLLAEAAPEPRAGRALAVGVALGSSLVAVWAAFFPDESLHTLGWVGKLALLATGLFVEAPSIAGTLVVCALLWARGVRLATSPLNFDDVFGRFRLGMVLVVAFHVVGLILGCVSHVRSITGGLLPNVAVFFFCGLLALALSRTEEERTETPGHSLRFNRQWGAVVVLALLGELFLVLLLAALLAPETVAFITTPLGWLGGLLLQVASWFFIAIAYVADAIIRGILWLLSLFGLAPQPFQLETATAPEFPEEPQDPDQPPSIPETVLAAARAGLVGGLTLLVLLVLWRSLRPRTQRKAATGDETRESVWSWDAAKRELAEVWRALLARLRRQRALASSALAGLTGGVLDGDDLTSVRGVYRALLRVAARAGVPQAPQQTAGEFQAALTAHTPEGAAEVATLTDAYLRVRYGQLGDEDVELPRVVPAWRRLRERLSGGGGST